jgi:hypothetical protein
MQVKFEDVKKDIAGEGANSQLSVELVCGLPSQWSLQSDTQITTRSLHSPKEGLVLEV